jgi:hypothetical protein
MCAFHMQMYTIKPYKHYLNLQELEIALSSLMSDINHEF